MKTGADLGPCPTCGEPNGGRYEHDGRWVCWSCLPASWRRPPRQRRPRPEPFGVFRARVRERLEGITGSTVFYLDERHTASYCPVCLDGTVRLAFSWQPEPAFTGTCSNGCTAAQIGEVIFA